MQVAHFDTTAVRRDISWVRGANAHLPRDISVEWARPVPDTFHCRASALSRRYAYILYVSPLCQQYFVGDELPMVLAYLDSIMPVKIRRIAWPGIGPWACKQIETSVDQKFALDAKETVRTRIV